MYHKWCEAQLRRLSVHFCIGSASKLSFASKSEFISFLKKNLSLYNFNFSD